MSKKNGKQEFYPVALNENEREIIFCSIDECKHCKNYDKTAIVNIQIVSIIKMQFFSSN